MKKWMAIGGCLIVVAISIIAFLNLVWPTPYRYDQISLRGATFPVRIHRTSGKTEILMPSGWRAVEAEEQYVPQPPKRAKLPPEQFAKLTGYCVVNRIGNLEASVYNGSTWTLEEITVNVTLLVNGEVSYKDRQYKLRRLKGTGAPNTNSEFNQSLYADIHPSDRYVVKIVAAEGDRPD